ncbi:hypothetical protein AB0A73_26035 [Glycomyces sp. NPDC047369]
MAIRRTTAKVTVRRTVTRQVTRRVTATGYAGLVPMTPVNPTTNNYYDGPVIEGDVVSSQLAWGNETVVQIQQQASIAPEWANLIATLDQIREAIGRLEMPQHNRGAALGAIAVAEAALTEPEPEEKEVHGALQLAWSLIEPFAGPILAGVPTDVRELALAILNQIATGM